MVSLNALPGTQIFAEVTSQQPILSDIFPSVYVAVKSLVSRIHTNLRSSQSALVKVIFTGTPGIQGIQGCYIYNVKNSIILKDGNWYR